MSVKLFLNAKLGTLLAELTFALIATNIHFSSTSFSAELKTLSDLYNVQSNIKLMTSRATWRHYDSKHNIRPNIRLAYSTQFMERQPGRCHIRWSLALAGLQECGYHRGLPLGTSTSTVAALGQMVVQLFSSVAVRGHLDDWKLCANPKKGPDWRPSPEEEVL